jgi:hypothetical protein
LINRCQSRAVAGRTYLLSRICDRFFHPNLSRRVSSSEAPLAALNLAGAMSHVQRANALTRRPDDPAAAMLREV